jgi:putative endonuclease
MSKHSKIGIKGEQLAEEFLLKKGYTIINKNWRYGKKEVDIIAHKDDILAIVEVKTRSGMAFGYPEESVNARKQQHLRDAAQAFADQHPHYRNIRFDIISISLARGQVTEIIHFEEAFY